MQQTEKLGLLWFCQRGQADEHICHAQIPLTFTLKRLLQTPRSFWRHYFTANYFHFLGFSLIMNQLYKMLFNSILKSVLDDDLRNRFNALVHLFSPGCFTWLAWRLMCSTRWFRMSFSLTHSRGLFTFHTIKGLPCLLSFFQHRSFQV